MTMIHTRLLAIAGSNFSGRTEYLKNRVSSESEMEILVPGEASVAGAFVGIDAHHYLSGLLPTVQGELALHGYHESRRRSAIADMLSCIELARISANNPFALSGGEQTLLALCTALLTATRIIAIDCALEQLGSVARAFVLSTMNHPDIQELMFLIADNRLSEYSNRLTAEQISGLVLATPSKSADIADFHFADVAAAEAIQLKGITFGYERRKPLFRDIEFEFVPGRVYFLHGDNGVGKSTLAKILCGILRPNAGQLNFGKKEGWAPWKCPGERVAYHFQNTDLQLFGTRVRDILSQARDLIEVFELERSIDQHPQDLPFTLRKRVALAASFARKKPWIVLDEPILGQDDKNAASLSRMLDLLAQNGGGAIVITHSEWFSRLSANGRCVRLTSRGLVSEIR